MIPKKIYLVWVPPAHDEDGSLIDGDFFNQYTDLVDAVEASEGEYIYEAIPKRIGKFITKKVIEKVPEKKPRRKK